MSKTLPLHYLDIVPLTSVPLTRDPWFSYVSTQPITLGSLVSIPLGKNKVRGIVIACHARRPRALPAFVKLKSVEKIIQEAFLTPEQIALARHISDTCFTPLGICFKHFAPTSVKTADTQSKTRRTALTLLAPHETTRSPKEKKSTPTTDQKKIIRQLLTRTRHSSTTDTPPSVLFGPPASGKTESALFVLHQFLSRNKTAQTLFLVPERTLVDDLMQRAQRHWHKDEIAVLQSHLSPRERTLAWERIRTGAARLILGTRQAIFAPFRQLGLIVLDDEHSDSYKQWDMAPRYDTRIAVQELARLHGAHLIFVASTPSLTCWNATRQKHFELFSLPRRPEQSPPACTVVNLRLERWKKNFSSLSQPLTEAIAETLARRHQTLLFVNHRGMSRFSVCVHCKTVLRCPDCDRALILDHSGRYQCTRCPYRTDEFPVCRECRGTKFKNFGIGTERVQRELEKKFPQAVIDRLDASVFSSPTKLKRVIHNFSSGKTQILVGTQAAALGWNLPTLSLIGIIDADSLFALPDFRADEKAFQVLTQVIYRAGRFAVGPPARAILQTFHPENPVFQNIFSADPSILYAKLLEERQLLQYPPINTALLLTARHVNQKKLDTLVKKQYHSLLEIQEKSLPELRLLYAGQYSKQRGVFSTKLLLCFPEKSLTETVFRDFLRRLPVEWTLDIDPISLV